MMKRFLSLLLLPIICYASDNESDVLAIKTDEFDNTVNQYPFLVVKFWAPWCEPCKAMAPAWEKAATLLKNDPSNVQLAKVNIVDEREMGSRFKILAFPTIKMFIHGSKEGENYEGPRDDPEGIVSFLKARAAEAGPSATTPNAADPNAPHPKAASKAAAPKAAAPKAAAPKAADAAPKAVDAKAGKAADAEAAEGDDPVLVLTDSNFDQALAEHPMVLVDFYAPWCGHCKTLEPNFRKAAAALRDAGAPRVALAKVDATVEKGLASKYEVKGFPTLKVFERGAKPVPYEGPRDAQGIVDHLRVLAGPPSTELADAEAAALLKASSPVLVVYAAAALDDLDAWMEVARPLRRRAAFAHSTDEAVWEALGVEEGVTVLKAFDEPLVRFDGRPADAGRLAEFVDYHRFQVAMPIKRGDKAALRVFFEDEARPSLFLFLADADAPEGRAALAAFREAARAVRGVMASGYFSASEFPEVFDVFGLKDAARRGELPEVLIELRQTSSRYRLGERNVTARAVARFLSDYLAGALTPYVKSQPEPADNGGPVFVVVGSTYQRDVVSAGRWVLLKAYAPWCGHCKTLAPVYEEVGAAYAGVAGVRVAKVDATENDLPAQALGLKSYPSLYLFRGDGAAPEPYAGERTARDLVRFVANRTGIPPSPAWAPKPEALPARPARPAEVPAQGPPPHLAPPPPPPAPAPAAGPEGAAEWVRRALAEEVQVPWMAAGYTVPGGFLLVPAALLALLLALAAASALAPGDAPPRAAAAAAAAAAKAGKAAAARAAAAKGGKEN